MVVLGGSEGGYDATPAAALAMAGYPAMALAYFGEPGLQRILQAQDGERAVQQTGEGDASRQLKNRVRQVWPAATQAAAPATFRPAA